MALKDIIDQRIGLGKYQIFVFVVLSLVGINDGVEVILSTLLNPIIKALHPQLTSSFISLLASLFFAGIIFGSLTSGHLADKYGRLTMIIYGAGLQIIAGVLFFLANSVFLIYLLRFFYGFVYGFSYSTVTSMFVQVIPTKYRGKGLILLSFFMALGKIYALFLGHIFIKADITQSKWKPMMLFGGAPSIFVLLGCIFMLYESPRFLLSMKRYDQAFVILDKIAVENNGNNAVLLSEEDKQQIKRQFEKYVQEKGDTSYLALFQQHNYKKTLFLAILWIIIHFCFYGQLTIEGLHISKGSHSPTNLKKYVLTVLGELPSFLIPLLLIDRPQFGRKHSIMLFYFGGAIFHMLFAVSSQTLMGTAALFFIKDVMQVIHPLTTESYETKMRLKGYSFCAASSKLGAAIMPYIVIPLDQWKQPSVYILFSLLMLIAAAIVWHFVEQTMNKNLDIDKSQILPAREQQAVYDHDF